MLRAHFRKEKVNYFQNYFWLAALASSRCAGIVVSTSILVIGRTLVAWGAHKIRRLVSEFVVPVLLERLVIKWKTRRHARWIELPLRTPLGIVIFLKPTIIELLKQKMEKQFKWGKCDSHWVHGNHWDKHSRSGSIHQL
jgi:hypothetical protein